MKKSVLRKRISAILFAISLAACCGVCVGQPTVDQATTRADSFTALLRQAETKSAAKQWHEAAALWEQVVQVNHVEGKFWNRLATAYYNAKDYRKSIPAYEKQIALGYGIPANAAYNVACNYALLGEKESALNWLEKAFELGFRNLTLAQTDKDLEALRGDARYQKQTGLVDTSKMSRVEGWRYDLQFFAREVSRKGFKVFRKISKTEFATSVGQLNDSIPKLTDIEVIIELMKLAAKLGDGHTTITGSEARPELLQTLPVQFYFFEEGLFIIAADPKYKALLGTQVLRFGDRTVAEVTGALEPLINRDDSPIWIKQRAPYFMRHLPLLHGLKLISDAEKVQLTVRGKDGKTSIITLAADSSQPNIWNVLPNPKLWINIPQTAPKPAPLYVKSMDQNYWFEYLPEAKTVYFQYNVIYDDKQESLAKFSARLFDFINRNEVEKLVLDMRWNNGGDTNLNQPLLENLVRCEKINQRGKLFVIIGRRVFSAGQNAATSFERYTKAIFVGEPTGSSPNFVGDEIFFPLPYSKLSANVSDLYWQTSTPADARTWIAPQIYLPPTFAAYSQNRDPVLEAILAYR